MRSARLDATLGVIFAVEDEDGKELRMAAVS